MFETLDLGPAPPHLLQGGSARLLDVAAKDDGVRREEAIQLGDDEGMLELDLRQNRSSDGMGWGHGNRPRKDRRSWRLGLLAAGFESRRSAFLMI